MSKNDLEIRPFGADDLPTLHSIRLTAFAPVFRSFRDQVGSELAALLYADAEQEQGEWLDQICSHNSSHRVFVAVKGVEVIGFCDHSVDPVSRIGTLGLNAVHPDAAGKGVGTALYRHAIEQMRAAGMEAVTVATGGDSSHAPARRAYAKAGFGRGIPSVHMSRVL